MCSHLCLHGSASGIDGCCLIGTRVKVTPILGKSCEATSAPACVMLLRRWQPRDKQASENVHKRRDRGQVFYRRAGRRPFSHHPPAHCRSRPPRKLPTSCLFGVLCDTTLHRVLYLDTPTRWTLNWCHGLCSSKRPPLFPSLGSFWSASPSTGIWKVCRHDHSV